eukprot:TRINITY_DN1211_c0_g1_i1.p1 TRINITY_DN1211_c0_g1~~TRINITY_DN1211_c0_g1_i1.p1  ORF type:complete len:364 (-),score=54.25 TRINITY_DN1211_c0_g1_i1:289-1329(-)
MTLEWMQNLEDIQVSLPGGGKAELGFWDLFTDKDPTGPPTNVTSAKEQVNEEIRRLVAKYHGEELSITVTGHSLGGALANLCAYDLASTGANQLRSGPVQVLDAELAKTLAQEANLVTSVVKDVKSIVLNPFGIVQTTVTTVTNVATGNTAPKLPNGFVAGTVPITVYTFASPRAGNDVFRDILHNLGVKMLRAVNSSDLVPRMPGIVTNEFLSNALDTTQLAGLIVDSVLWTYTHAGVELSLNNYNSPFLRTTVDVVGFHLMQTYLHLIAGYVSKEKTFDSELAQERDIVLVNDNTDFLKDKYVVPSNWKVTANKGLVRVPGTGLWIQRPRSEEDLPSKFLEVAL